MRRLIEFMSETLGTQDWPEFLWDEDIKEFWKEFNSKLRDGEKPPVVQVIRHIELSEIKEHMVTTRNVYLEAYPYAKIGDFNEWFFKDIDKMCNQYLDCENIFGVLATKTFNAYRHEFRWGDTWTAVESKYNDLFMKHYMRAIGDFYMQISNEVEEQKNDPNESQNSVSGVELKTIKEQIRLLYDLGVIDHLVGKYPNSLNDNNNQVAKLISQIIKSPQTTTQPYVNALLNDTASDRNYPKETSRTKSIINDLDVNEKF